MSQVWNYFRVNEQEKNKAVCKLCSTKLSRGGLKATAYNTSNLIKHLEAKHKTEYAEFKAASSTTAAASGTLQQPTVTEAIQRREKLAKDHPRALKITRGLTEMITLDDQPLSLVDNVGFRRFMDIVEPRYEIPGRHLITDNALPKLHKFVKEYTLNLMCAASDVSFTTDIWSSSVSPMSLISLTAQWIDGGFELKRVTLQARECRGSHTAMRIAETFCDMLEEWKVKKEAVHVVVRDNAANIKKAMTDAQLPSIPCVAHTLQLAVHEGLLSQRSVIDAVAIGRRIVGHFSHSPLAYSQLEDIQQEIHQDVKRLHQDVQTRWNSTFYMMQSLLEQKRALGIFAEEHGLPGTLSANQWSLLEKSVAALAPFEELTRKVGYMSVYKTIYIL